MITINLPLVSSSYNENLINLINAARNELNLNNLIHDDLLYNAAFFYCKHMYQNQYLKHDTYVRENGDLIFIENFGQRLCRLTNYCNNWLGECIAYGSFINDADIFKAFWNSLPHRNVLLHPNYTHIGLAQYELYVTIDLKG